MVQGILRGYSLRVSVPIAACHNGFRLGHSSRKVIIMRQHLKASSLFILSLSGIIGYIVGCSPEQQMAIPNNVAGSASNGGAGGSSSTPSGTGGDSYPGTGGAGANTGGAGANTGGANANTGGAGANVGGAGVTGGAAGVTGGSKATTGGAGVTGGSKATTGGKAGTTGGAGVTTGGASVVTPTGGAATTTGGAAGPTGGAAATNSGTTVTFSSSGKATGAMSGWAYVSLGSGDSITDPTCGGTTITNAAPCNTSTTWTGGVCMTGDVPALPASPTDADYKANWGVSIGVNAGDPDTVTLGQSFTSITFAMTGTPSTGLRAQVTTSDGTVYCATMTPGTALALTSFKVSCYAATPGAALTAAGVKNITKVEVQVSSSSTDTPVTKLCLTGITFG